jgi:hypothetical protein
MAERGAREHHRPMTGRRVLVAVSVLSLAILAGFLVWHSGPRESDEDKIRRLVLDAARAAEERRASDAVVPLSARFVGESLDRDGVRRLIALEALEGAWTSVTVTGLSIAVVEDRARSAFDVVASRGGSGNRLSDLLPAQASAWRVDCEWERERAGFRVVRAAWREVSLADVIASPPFVDPP